MSATVEAAVPAGKKRCGPKRAAGDEAILAGPTMVMGADAVAHKLGISRAKVYELARSGELRGLKVGGVMRFHRDDVADYVARCWTGPGPAREL